MMFKRESRIPLELYPYIIEHVDNKATLLSMLISSGAIFAAVQRKIYHSVEFSHCNDDKHVLFLKSVLNPDRVHLLGLIRRYTYITHTSTSHILVNLIKQALASFMNLKQLKLVLFEDTSSALLPERPPFQLVSLSWVCIQRAHSESRILQFLATQHSLTTLIFFYQRDPQPSWPQISLDNLCSLRNVLCSPAVLLPLVPRSITIKRMCCLFSDGQDLSHFPQLTDLRVLSFAPDTPFPLIHAVAKRFRTVQVLGFYSVDDNKLSDLYQLPLHTVVFNGTVKHLRIIKDMFCNMKRLQRVFHPASVTIIGGEPPRQYSRWDRGAETCVLVERDAVETNWNYNK